MDKTDMMLKGLLAFLVGMVAISIAIGGAICAQGLAAAIGWPWVILIGVTWAAVSATVYWALG